MFGKFLWNKQSLLHLFPHNKPRKVRYVGQGWNDHIKAVVVPEIEKWWPSARKVTRRGNGVITDTFWKDMKTGSTMEIMSNNQQVPYFFLVGNKKDLVMEEDLESIAEICEKILKENEFFKHYFFVSALTGDGLQALYKELYKYLFSRR